MEAQKQAMAQVRFVSNSNELIHSVYIYLVILAIDVTRPDILCIMNSVLSYGNNTVLANSIQVDPAAKKT